MILWPSAKPRGYRTARKGRRFGYVVPISSPTADNTVSGYTINSATGALTAITGSPFATGGGGLVVAVDPSGTFAYTPNFANNAVSRFAIDSATGALTSIAGSRFPTGLGPVDIAFTGSSVSITSPSDGAKPRSRYVALTGNGEPR